MNISIESEMKDLEQDSTNLILRICRHVYKLLTRLCCNKE